MRDSTINYALVKQLRDAGFPQGDTEWEYAYHESNYDGSPLSTPVRVLSGSKDEDWDTYVAAPTLSELIEVCGEGFAQIIRHQPFEGREDNWQATNNVPTLIQGWGITPEEAVAHLWLALNKV